MNVNKIKLDTFLFAISLLRYFTFWVLGLELLYYLGYIKNIEITLIFLHIIVLIGSYIFVKIKPKKLDVELHTTNKLIKYTFKNTELLFFDMLFHWIPFIILLIVILKKNDTLKNNNYLNLMIPLLYYVSFDIKKLYKMNENILLYLFIIVYLIFFILFE